MERPNINNQAIVILGGYLSNQSFYRGMSRSLRQLTGRPVWVVNVLLRDWLPFGTPAGMSYLLDKLRVTVDQARQATNGSKVTLIGHSAGGLLMRLYLGPDEFRGLRYAGVEHVDRLICLGSPHYNQGGWRSGGPVSRQIQERYPDACFSKEVQYTSVAGRWICGTNFGPLLAAWAYGRYRDFGGDGTAWGDGVIPVNSALLNGSIQLTIPDVSHSGYFGQLWYGSDAIIPRWWDAAQGN